MALTEAVALAPIAFTFCVGALRQADASLESAVQVCGAGPVRILRSVVVPMLRPPIVYSSVLIVSMSLETLSVPLLYGQPSDAVDPDGVAVPGPGCVPRASLQAKRIRQRWM